MTSKDLNNVCVRWAKERISEGKRRKHVGFVDLHVTEMLGDILMPALLQSPKLQVRARPFAKAMLAKLSTIVH